MSENERNQGEREGWDAKVEGCCRGGEIPAYRAPSGRAPEQFAPKALCFRSSVLLRLRRCGPSPDPPGRRSVSRGSPPASADALDLRVPPLPLSPISDFRGR